jgi:hypothetical protein
VLFGFGSSLSIDLQFQIAHLMCNAERIIGGAPQVPLIAVRSSREGGIAKTLLRVRDALFDLLKTVKRAPGRLYDTLSAS